MLMTINRNRALVELNSTGMTRQHFTKINSILKVGLALLIVSCGSKGGNDFVSQWESEIKSAIDSCDIQSVKVYHLKDLGFVKSKGIRNKIVQGIGNKWTELKAVEHFGDDPNNYFASILLDDSILYNVHFQKESESFSMIEVPKGHSDYERGVNQFEDFPPYIIKCDSSANTFFYYAGRRD
jgi:hypothetical protein